MISLRRAARATGVLLVAGMAAGLLPAGCGGGGAGSTAWAQQAAPAVAITSPAAGAVLPGPDVPVHVAVSGLGLAAGCCNLHILLDQQMFRVQYDPRHPTLLRDVQPGTHLLRVFAADKQHRAIPGTLAVVAFSVGYCSDENLLAGGQPLLTYNLPQGNYLGVDAGDVAIDFIVSGVQLAPRGWRVAYFVDGKRYLAFAPGTYHVKGLLPGTHSVRLELQDEKGRVAEGPFNSVERLIDVRPDRVTREPLPGENPDRLPVIDSIKGAMTNGQSWVAVPGDRASATELGLPGAHSQPRTGGLTVRRRGAAPERAINAPPARAGEELQTEGELLAPLATPAAGAPEAASAVPADRVSGRRPGFEPEAGTERDSGAAAAAGQRGPQAGAAAGGSASANFATAQQVMAERDRRASGRGSARIEELAPVSGSARISKSTTTTTTTTTITEAATESNEPQRGSGGRRTRSGLAPAPLRGTRVVGLSANAADQASTGTAEARLRMGAPGADGSATTRTLTTAGSSAATTPSLAGSSIIRRDQRGNIIDGNGTVLTAADAATTTSNAAIAAPAPLSPTAARPQFTPPPLP